MWRKAGSVPDTVVFTKKNFHEAGVSGVLLRMWVEGVKSGLGVRVQPPETAMSPASQETVKNSPGDGGPGTSTSTTAV